MRLRIALPDLGDRQVRHRLAVAVADELGEAVARSSHQRDEVLMRRWGEPDVVREGRDADELGFERRERAKVLGERSEQKIVILDVAPERRQDGDVWREEPCHGSRLITEAKRADESSAGTVTKAADWRFTRSPPVSETRS